MALETPACPYCGSPMHNEVKKLEPDRAIRRQRVRRHIWGWVWRCRHCGHESALRPGDENYGLLEKR